jgi:hypothetical protein
VATGAGLGAAVGGVDEKKWELLKTLEVLEHPDSSVAPAANRPASERRRVGSAGAAVRTCNSADIAVPSPLPAQRHRLSAIGHIGGEKLTK